MLKSITLVVIALFSMIVLQSPSAQGQSPANAGFEKKAFNYAEWTKGKFSEVVTVTNPGKYIFLGAPATRASKTAKSCIPATSTHSASTRSTRSRRLLALHGASLKDVVKMTIFVSDMRFFLTDWIKCRGEEYAGFDLPASALIGVSSFAWPHMLLEIQAEAMLPR